MKIPKINSIKNKLTKLFNVFIYILNALLLIYISVAIYGNLQRFKESENKKTIFTQLHSLEQLTIGN